MCTAITMNMGDFYFGRTLDYDHSFGEEVTVTPRNFAFPFRHCQTIVHHYAIIGMARVEQGYPLYFDAVNEKGLAMGGLNFVGYAHYRKPENGKRNIASFELIPWILSQCASVSEAKKQLDRTNITDTAFHSQLPPSQLHWIIADRKESIVVEATKKGLTVYDNPVGVLTNNPEFDDQLFHLNDFMALSPNDPVNRISDQINLERYSRGMGALGLPGDLSSRSRFVRAVFTKLNGRKDDTDAVSQFFHILGTVEQVNGCCKVGEGKYERTLYTSCCNADKGIYYYTTYEKRQITGIDMNREDINGTNLIQYPLIRKEQIDFQN